MTRWVPRGRWCNVDEDNDHTCIVVASSNVALSKGLVIALHRNAGSRLFDTNASLYRVSEEPSSSYLSRAGIESNTSKQLALIAYLKTCFCTVRLLRLCARILCACGLAANALSLTSSHCYRDSELWILEYETAIKDRKVELDIEV